MHFRANLNVHLDDIQWNEIANLMARNFNNIWPYTQFVEYDKPLPKYLIH